MRWNRRTDNRDAERVRRRLTSERLESRQLLAADPINVGLVYLETDYLETEQDSGGDSRGDRFILSFNGGAPDTELSEVRIVTDKDGDGLSVGDPIFDTAPGGRGKDGSHGFQVVRIQSSDGREIDAVAEVEDGGQELVLRLSNFKAGDRLEFTLDVDEVLRNAVDLAIFNDRLDVITSGQEFQDSILNATFEAPHYETSHADAIFINDFGDPASTTGLNLPPDDGDDIDSRPNRSAAAVGSTSQVALPISISGHVWVDNDLDMVREVGEQLLSGIELSLFQRDEASGQYVDTGFRSQTDTNGRYEFAQSLALLPGDYRVVETQPAGLFSVGAFPGTIDGGVSGVAESPNVITNIVIPLGGQASINNDFAEAQPASIRGYVYQDDSNDGVRDPGETGIAGVSVRLVPVDTISPQSELTVTTDADGAYSFEGLAPGEYEIIEVSQPAGLTDGLDSAGTIDGIVVGVAENDQLTGIFLNGDDDGIEYNFGELALGSLSGFVYLAAPGEDCTGEHDGNGQTPLPGTRIQLQSVDGIVITEVFTDADGRYSFDSLPLGEYRIVQFTPEGLLDGSAHPGSISGVQVGDAVDGGLIQGITLDAGGVGTEFNFCEIAPATISGFVYHDRSNDGSRDGGEEGIEGTTITLLDVDGNVVATTTTDINGRYEFVGIPPGEYALVETQPSEYLDGVDTVGLIDGQRVGELGDDSDSFRSISIRQGQEATEYNFGELLGATLSGSVHVDADGDCVQDPNEEGLSGVTIRLLDESGQQIAQTQTDSQGRYEFEGLGPGNYTIVEEQPDGYFDGGAVAGTEGGNVETPNRITQISLGSGDVAEAYNFCEIAPSSISGFVHVDSDGDSEFDANEETIVGVNIELRDGAGVVIATTQTDSQGRYEFAELRPGEYQIFQQQPDGFFHGGQDIGSGGGQVLGDDLLGVQLLAGVDLTNYNFCELEPASISGFVWADVDLNAEFNPGDQPIPGVLVELIDSTGDVVQQTNTNDSGEYQFVNLEPGEYSVRETTPTGFFDGGELVGSVGGQIVGDDFITGIVLESGVNAVHYDFYEVPPAEISGFVFQDGDAIVLDEPLDPANLREFRDGVLTEDDMPIAGVTIELRNVFGDAFVGENALPGIYPSGPIVATTDENGFYQFVGLRPGSYHLYQLQPEGFIDGLDTAGTTGGIPINQADLRDDPNEIIVQQLSANEATDPGEDAILNVSLIGFQSSENNNFSEIIIETPPPPPPQGDFLEQLEPEIREVNDPLIENFDPRITISTFASTEDLRAPIIAFDEWAVSWHLSVINGGFPRGIVGEDVLHNASAKANVDWVNEDYAKGRWQFMNDNGDVTKDGSDYDLGGEDSVALSGDFDGDGVDEIAVYENGQWLVDLNGNGRLDKGDMWMQLGTLLDRPVVGDWDGDGKDDIGIFGRQWERDPEKIKRDPGLPDPANERRRQVDRNELVSRKPIEGEDHIRFLQRGDAGNLRADAVDHVFQYGDQVDEPIAGDWNGDGIDQIGVYRNGTWLLDTDGDGRWTKRDTTAKFGNAGDQPIVGDFNGDGIDEIAVVRGDVWIIDSDGDGKLTGNDKQIQVPRESENSQPVVGDWDGDGKDDPGMYDDRAA